MRTPAGRPDRTPADWATSIITRRPTAWLVALLPLILAVLALALLGEGDRERTVSDSLPAGKDSTRGTQLRDALPSEGGSTAVIVYSADSGVLSAATLEQLRAQAEALGAVAAGPAGALTVAQDGTAALAVVPIASVSATESADAVADLRDQLASGAPAGVTAQVTGPAAIQADLAAVFQGADIRLLLVTASVVAVLLVLTYRSPILWVVPLAVVGIADRLAGVVATQVMAALDIAWDESTIGILSVLVFGAGTNYALLLISRYRDELKRTQERHDAMAIAVRRTADAVLASATTVVLGLLTLLLSLTPTTRGLGVACAIGIVVAAAFVLVVLPAVLVLFGRWVFWPRAPRVGDTVLIDSDSLWHRIGARVARRPGAVIAGSVLLLAALAAGIVRIDTGLDQADQFLERPEAIAAAERLNQSFPAGVSDPTQVVTTDDPGPVIEQIQSLASVTSAVLAAEGGGVAQIDVVLDASPGSEAARDAIAELRESLLPFRGTSVTGTEATAIDESAAASRDLRVIVPLILILVLGALLVLLRSVVAPLLLVATVVATYCASIGLSWWVFTGLLGFEALDSGIPLLAFLFLVALGVDYNIFLVTRAREEAVEHGSRDGMLRALTATGGVITSAGILLAAVFAVLGVLPLVLLAQLGTIICIGVLLDTLLVRTVLVPALALQLGDRFWWPRRIAAAAPGAADTVGSR